MTVHGAKGLQFDHVFLPFLAFKNRQSTWQEVSQVPELGLWSVRLPKREEPAFAGDLLEALALEDLRQREEEESLRVLYVAMTRAKKSLALSWTGSIKDNSWASLVEQALPGIPSHLYERQSSPMMERRLWGESFQAQEPRPPYQVMAKERVSDQYVSDLPNQMDPFKVLQKRHWGILSHRLFEGLKYHSPEHLAQSLRLWGLNETAPIDQA